MICKTVEVSEESLDAHDKEVARLKAYYEANKEMIENVDKWQSLFKKFLDFEVFFIEFYLLKIIGPQPLWFHMCIRAIRKLLHLNV